MKGKLVLALAALAITSVSYAQTPVFPSWRAMAARMQPTPITASPVSVEAQTVAAAQETVPAQFAGHHHRGGGGYGYGGGYASGYSYGGMNSGCSSCGGNNGNFAGDCCQDYAPYSSMGLWNNYCGGRGCGHHGKHGCGGCGMGCGRCCTKVPIGMYGVTPYGCCMAGICGCGGCGGCGMGCGKHHGGCRQTGWRWGAGGCGCDGTTGAVGCSSCAGNGGYDGAPANGVPMDAAPAVPEEAPPVAPMDPPSTPTSLKSARTLFKNAFTPR